MFKLKSKSKHKQDPKAASEQLIISEQNNEISTDKKIVLENNEVDKKSKKGEC